MIKKIALFTGLFLVAGVAKAGWLDEAPDQYTVVFASVPAGVSVSTTIVMVPLSSTTWSHPTDARAIVVDSVSSDVDKTAATTAIVKFGVIREINSSSGTVTWFETQGQGLNVSNTNAYRNTFYEGGGLNCRVNPRSQSFGPNLGTTPFLLTNDTLTSTSLTTSLPLPSVVGGIIALPRVGDIVANVVTSAVVSNFTLTVRYHIETK